MQGSRLLTPVTPDSASASGLYQATSAIDDSLTRAIASLSQLRSPLEPQENICCCCGKQECENTRNWLKFKAKLEEDLRMCAEIGCALLQRHDKYVRSHEPTDSTLDQNSEDVPYDDYLEQDTEVDARTAKHTKGNVVPHKRFNCGVTEISGSVSCDDVSEQNFDVDATIAEVRKENAALNKRLEQALLNIEITEEYNSTTLQELEEARNEISKLTVQQARVVELESKLDVALRERDDIRQECNSESQRAKQAESRLAALEARADNLQAEVRRLENERVISQTQELETSQSFVKEVRARLKELQSNKSGRLAIDPNTGSCLEVINSLVSRKEALQKENEELLKLLKESREDVQTLRAQVEEYSILPPSTREIETPPQHIRTIGGPSPLGKDSAVRFARRPASVDSRSRYSYEPLTPETDCRPLSTSIHSHSVHVTSQTSIDTEEDSGCLRELALTDQLTKSSETDRSSSMNLPLHLGSSAIDRFSPSLHDGSSESSSLFESQTSPLSSLLQHMSSFLHRMSQADALTLISRLKRQHLQGAHVKHLSRTMVNTIISEIAQVRTQFRVYLDDEKTTLLCTRRDLRLMFKLFKDAFDEMAQMRLTLNEIAVDQMERKSSGSVTGSSWIAPISRLLGTSLYDLGSQLTSSSTQQENRQVRAAPKIGPALAASSTTVNVEFSGAGAGRMITNLVSTPSIGGAEGDDQFPKLNTTQIPAAATSTGHSVMGIFAGAPRQGASEPWLIVPRGPRRVKSTNFKSDASEQFSTVGRVAGMSYATQSLRGVDAVVDAGSADNDGGPEADDVPGPLPLERSLHRRGRSDSSIRSTFASHAEITGTSGELLGSLPRRPSVMRTISRTMQSFRQVASNTISGVSNVVAVPSLSVTGDMTSKPSEELVPPPNPARSPSPSLSSLLPSTRPSPSQLASQHYFGRIGQDIEPHW